VQSSCQLSIQLQRHPFSTPLAEFNLTADPQLSGSSQSYVTTDGQSDCLSWNKATIWGLRPYLYYCQTVAGLLMWGVLSDERTGLSFAGVTVSSNKSVVILGSESRGTRDNILLSQIRDFPFRRLIRLAGLRWRYSTPPPHGICPGRPNCLPYNDFGQTEQETPFPTIPLPLLSAVT
jgi:hypothetical protein